jgi:endoribonuclease LACTB2
MTGFRAAACVVLHRRGPGGLEVLLARRAETLTFLGGFDAFPGGSVDAVDDGVGIDRQKSAALRELFEEVGVLVADGAERLSPTSREALRKELVVGKGAGWAAMLAEHGWRLSDAALVPMGRWVTPPYTPMRFDAMYYAVAAPPGQEAVVWPGELTRCEWVRPRDAVARHHKGELFITYPVMETLRRIVDCDDDVLAAAGQMTAKGYVSYPHAGGEMIAGVYMVPGRTPTLPPATHTNTFVLGGADLVVVDPATPYEDEQAGLIAFLEHLESEGGTVREIWLTHHHIDHVGAVARVQERFGVPVAAHRLTAAEVAGELTVKRLIDDGDVQKLRGHGGVVREWRALHTPGHTRGHVCFYEPELGSLLSGDLVLGYGSVLVAPPDGNMKHYMDSLDRLLTMRLGFVFPAHGPPVAAAHHKIKEYIAHRTMREEAIVAALRGAGAGLASGEIVPLVYTDVKQEAWPLAELNVRAHLEKLVEEGRVRAVGNAFVLAPA